MFEVRMDIAPNSAECMAMVISACPTLCINLALLSAIEVSPAGTDAGTGASDAEDEGVLSWPRAAVCIVAACGIGATIPCVAVSDTTAVVAELPSGIFPREPKASLRVAIGSPPGCERRPCSGESVVSSLASALGEFAASFTASFELTIIFFAFATTLLAVPFARAAPTDEKPKLKDFTALYFEPCIIPTELKASVERLPDPLGTIEMDAEGSGDI
jgi:hypothetical protein